MLALPISAIVFCQQRNVADRSKCIFLKKSTTSGTWHSLMQIWCELPTPWLQACWGRDWSKYQIFPGLIDKLNVGTKQRQNLSQTPCQRTPCSQRDLGEEILCKLQLSRVVFGVYLLNLGAWEWGWGWGGRSPQEKHAKRVQSWCVSVGFMGLQLLDGSRGHQIPPSHAFQGERKGLRLFFS